MLTAGCSQSLSTIHKSETCNNTQLPHTRYLAKGYEVKIFYPNSKTNADTWDGPFCIRKQNTTRYCHKDFSLIKSFSINDKTGVVSVIIFSGSNTRTEKVMVFTCQ